MRRGFTLIEMLISISIIMMLVGMLMPMLAVVRNATMRSETEFVLKRVDTALRQFKIDWGVMPYQSSYPDPVPPDTAGGFPNRLFYHLGTDIGNTGPSPTDAERIKADMDTAEARYDETTASPLKFVSADTNGNALGASRLNRQAREQVRLGVLSGNLDMRGVVFTNSSGVLVDRSGTQVLSAAASAANASGPGWACDYLNGQLDARFHFGSAVLDSWGFPLVYLHRTLPAIRTADNSYPIMRFGMGANCISPTAVDGPGPALRGAVNRPQLLYAGRIRLADVVADGQALPAISPWLPDPANRMASDARWFSAPGFETDCELWSTGRDGAFAYMRDHPSNKDNIAVVPYLKGLLP